MAENIGMTARAMMNMALDKLRVVAPRENPRGEKACSAASGAHSILEEARVFATLDEALADVHYVLASSARPRDMTKPVLSPDEAPERLLTHLKNGEKTALLFGPERTGLENHELVAADGIIEIPLNPKHRSLNLSQAVLLIGYEFFKATHGADFHHACLETGQAQPADKQSVKALLTHLEDALAQRNYFRFPDKEERMRRNLENIFTRNALTASEVKTLHGVITDLTRPLP